MKVYGFDIGGDADWLADPFYSTGLSPEERISSAAHVYRAKDGRYVVGFELRLGMDKKTMDELLEPYSARLAEFEVYEWPGMLF